MDRSGTRPPERDLATLGLHAYAPGFLSTTLENEAIATVESEAAQRSHA
jgi:hypothetical protein